MYQLGSLLSGHAGVATYAMCACNFAIAFALATVVSALTLIGARRRRDRNRRGD